MAKVIIGVDPHKLLATIEVVDGHEKLLGSGGSAHRPARLRGHADLCEDLARTGSGRSRAATAPGDHWRSGCARPASMSWTCRPSSPPRVRLFGTGHNRTTDARDAHSIAIVAVRTKTLRVLRRDGELEALRMLCDRREELTRLRVQTVNLLQWLLAELVPGQAKKDLTALQAKAILATVQPPDVAGKTRRRIAC
jgi:transposase